MRHLTACLTVAALAGALPVRAEDAPARALAITGVTVIDATGVPARPGMTVVVTGDRITAIGKSGDVRVPQEARVVDADGKYLIPGLWDMHVHIASPSFLPLYLANGVTGVRDMHALDPDAIFGSKRSGGQTARPASSPPGRRGWAQPRASSLVAADAAEARGRPQAEEDGGGLRRVYTKLPAGRTCPLLTRRRSRASPSQATSPSRSASPRRPTWARRASSTSPGSS
jgi:hypothetical protein